MNFEITEEEGKENVTIGKYKVLKSGIYLKKRKNNNNRTNRI